MMGDNYDIFLGKKLNYGYSDPIPQVKNNSKLFGFQSDIVSWALRHGRAAIFADCGLGKTPMQLAWADNIDGKVIIFAPLSVNEQTISEGVKFGIDVSLYDVNDGCKIKIANYENLDKINPDDYKAIVIDESSILKSVDSKTRARLIDFAKNIQYRLACTATPAPNDISEIANHTEFLGIMKREEMLAKWFYNDGKNWTLKGHAVNKFYEWIATWGMFITKPSDIGHSDDGFVLPELSINPIYFDFEWKQEGTLFNIGLKGIQDRMAIRKDSVSIKADEIARIVNSSDGQWMLWAGIDLESDTLEKLIPGSENLKGSDSKEEKTRKISDFKSGKCRVLISKPKIAGFGLNFQQSHNMIFFGLSDSYEAYYQCIRRQYRFGQQNKVNVFIALAGNESIVLDNVLKKETEAKRMSEEVIKHVKKIEEDEIHGQKHQQIEYSENLIKSKNYILYNGDSCEVLKKIGPESIDMSVYSPPFASLYTYSNSNRDLGNCQTQDEFIQHYEYIVKEIIRVTKQGRNTCVHCMNIPTTKIKHGYIGLIDFRGDIIRLYEKCGWIYYGEVCIWKNPQVQSIRSHSIMLTFNQFNKDSMKSAPAIPDYVLLFKKPGENKIPVVPANNGLSNDKWIEYASPIWMDIRQTHTLNSMKADKDEKHMCPLQLDVIERLIDLYSNKGETVLSPFAGVGSEGYMAIKKDRKFIGIELKNEYFNQALKNIKHADDEKRKGMLFDAEEFTDNPCVA